MYPIDEVIYMDDYKKENSNYEPNFIMRDPEPGETTSQETENQTGAFRDPRDNFRKHGSESSSSTASYGTNGYEDTLYYNHSGDSASWDNQNGLGKVRRKRTRKESKPVTLTRRSLALIVACLLYTSRCV